MSLVQWVLNVFLVSAVGLSFSHAQAGPKRSAQYGQCIDSVDLGAFKNSQWAACSAEEIARQDTTLNTEYKKLGKTLTVEQKAALAKAQNAWLKFREDWCRFEERGPAAPGGRANYNFCILELTDQQIEALQGLQP